MKKILIGLALLGTLAATKVEAVLLSGVSDSFINNGTYVCLTNLTTTGLAVYGFTNKYSGTNLIYFSYPVGTNVISGSTNTFGTQLPPTFVDVDLMPDANGDVNPNLALSCTIGVYSNWPAPSVLSPVVMNTIWTNPAASTAPATGTGTNQVTFTFAPVSPDGMADVYKTFTWVVNPAPVGLAVPYTQSTNLSTTFLQGALKLRLIQVIVSSNNSTASGVVLDSLKLTGWKP